MDNDIIRAKLESLSRCIKRIEDKMPASVEELQTNLDLQDIITLNLERACKWETRPWNWAKYLIKHDLNS